MGSVPVKLRYAPPLRTRRCHVANERKSFSSNRASRSLRVIILIHLICLALKAHTVLTHPLVSTQAES
jgi:hypothetical protein